MKRFEVIILALCVPLSFAAQSGCSSDSPSSQRRQPQNEDLSQNPNQAPSEETPTEEQGEEPGEGGEDASTADTGGGAIDGGAAGDTGTGAVDTGGGATDTGTGATDTGTGVTDTGTGAVDTGGPQTHTVQLETMSFSPSNLTVHVGDTVTWNWATPTHSVTSGSGCIPDGKFDSGIRASGSFSQTFTTAGTVPYFCSVHCALGMTGQVVVLP